MLVNYYQLMKSDINKNNRKKDKKRKRDNSIEITGIKKINSK